MEVITHEVVERTWQEVGNMDPEDAGVAMFDFSESQPFLLAFVMALAEELGSDASELCTYMVFVIYKMFANSTSDSIPVISEDQIEHHYQATYKLVDELAESSDDELEEMAVSTNNQPFVYKYLSETLFEEDDDADDDLDISDEEVGVIFMTLKCVIDAVDDATT